MSRAIKDQKKSGLRVLHFHTTWNNWYFYAREKSTQATGIKEDFLTKVMTIELKTTNRFTFLAFILTDGLQDVMVLEGELH